MKKESAKQSDAGLSPPVYLLEADETIRLVRRAEGVEDLVARVPGVEAGEGAGA